jgi:hypothetical protein
VDQVSAKAAGTDTSAKEPTKSERKWSKVVSQGWANTYRLVDALIWKQEHQHWSSRAKLNANPNTQPMQRAILIQLLIPMEIAINPKLGGAASAMLSDDQKRHGDQISRDPGIPAGFLKV